MVENLEYLRLKQSSFSTFCDKAQRIFQPILESGEFNIALYKSRNTILVYKIPLLKTTNIRCLEIITDSRYNMTEQREGFFLQHGLKKRITQKQVWKGHTMKWIQRSGQNTSSRCSTRSYRMLIDYWHQVPFLSALCAMIKLF